jgi:hypothetical protein
VPSVKLPSVHSAAHADEQACAAAASPKSHTARQPATQGESVGAIEGAIVGATVGAAVGEAVGAPAAGALVTWMLVVSTTRSPAAIVTPCCAAAATSAPSKAGAASSACTADAAAALLDVTITVSTMPSDRRRAPPAAAAAAADTDSCTDSTLTLSAAAKPRRNASRLSAVNDATVSPARLSDTVVCTTGAVSRSCDQSGARKPTAAATLKLQSTGRLHSPRSMQSSVSSPRVLTLHIGSVGATVGASVGLDAAGVGTIVESEWLPGTPHMDAHACQHAAC